MFEAILNPIRRAFAQPAENFVSVEEGAAAARTGSDERVFDSLSQLFPYTGYDKDARLFLIEGEKPETVEGLGFVIEVSQQVGASPEMSAALAEMIQRVGEHKVGIQFTAFGSPDLRHLFANMRAVVEDHGSKPLNAQGLTEAEFKVRQDRHGALHELNERRIRYYSRATTRDLFPSTNYRMRDVRCFISAVFPSKTVNESVIRAASAVRDTVRSTLDAYHLGGHDWEAADLIYFLAMILNPHRTLAGELPMASYDEGMELRKQVVHRDTRCEELSDRFVFFGSEPGQRAIIQALSPMRYPPRMQLPHVLNLLAQADGTTFPCTYVYTVGAACPDYDAQKSKTMVKAMRAQQTADSQISRYMPGSAEINKDFKIAQMVYQSGGREIQLYHQIILFSHEEDAARSKDIASAIFRAQGYELTVDSMITKGCLLGACPMLFGPLLQRDFKIAGKTTTKFTHNAANSIPILNTFRGTPPREREKHSRAVLTTFARSGQYIVSDIFANPSGNYNGAIVGTSGSGKSTFCNELVMRTLAEGDRCWVIDVGRSYEKLCSRLGGRFIQFGTTEKMNLNPFALFQSVVEGYIFTQGAWTEEQEDQEKEDLDMLLPVFEQMISPSRPLTDYERRQLMLHVQSVMLDARLEGRIANLDELSTSLINNCEMGGPNPGQNDRAWQEKVRNMEWGERSKYCDPKIRELGQNLVQFTSMGAYGEYFSGREAVTLSKDQFVVLELEELNNRPALRSVVLMLLMRLITNEMYLGSRSQGKVVLLDEAWDLLKEGNDGTAKFIEIGYRRARKYGGSFLTATQNVADYDQSPLARACLANADWLFLLRQKAESVDALKASGKFALDKHTEDPVRGLKTETGKYSEIFIRCGDLPPSVSRLYFDPFTLLLASSKADDMEAVDAYKRRGMSTAEAISAVLEDRGQYV